MDALLICESLKEKMKECAHPQKLSWQKKNIRYILIYDITPIRFFSIETGLEKCSYKESLYNPVDDSSWSVRTEILNLIFSFSAKNPQIILKIPFHGNPQRVYSLQNSLRTMILIGYPYPQKQNPKDSS